MIENKDAKHAKTSFKINNTIFVNPNTRAEKSFSNQIVIVGLGICFYYFLKKKQAKEIQVIKGGK